MSHRWEECSSHLLRSVLVLFKLSHIGANSKDLSTVIDHWSLHLDVFFRVLGLENTVNFNLLILHFLMQPYEVSPEIFHGHPFSEAILLLSPRWSRTCTIVRMLFSLSTSPCICASEWWRYCILLVLSRAILNLGRYQHILLIICGHCRASVLRKV